MPTYIIRPLGGTLILTPTSIQPPPVQTMSVTWVTRDMQTTWVTRDGRVTWKTRG